MSTVRQLTDAEIRQRRDVVASIAERRRAQTHCSRGHELTPDNTYIRPNGGARDCRECRRQWQREQQAFWRGLLSVDPSHELHGTPLGYQRGCRCARCAYAMSEHRRAA